MKIEAKATLPKRKPADLLVLLLDKERELSRTADPTLGPLLGQLAQNYGEGRIKKEYFSASPSKAVRHILVQHTSLVKPYDLPEKVKILAARALDQAHDLDLTQVTFLLNGKDAPELFGAVVEGVALGGYRFDKYRKEKGPLLGKASGLALCGRRQTESVPGGSGSDSADFRVCEWEPRTGERTRGRGLPGGDCRSGASDRQGARTQGFGAG